MTVQCRAITATVSVEEPVEVEVPSRRKHQRHLLVSAQPLSTEIRTTPTHLRHRHIPNTTTLNTQTPPPPPICIRPRISKTILTNSNTNKPPTTPTTSTHLPRHDSPASSPRNGMLASEAVPSSTVHYRNNTPNKTTTWPVVYSAPTPSPAPPPAGEETQTAQAPYTFPAATPSRKSPRCAAMAAWAGRAAVGA